MVAGFISLMSNTPYQVEYAVLSRMEISFIAGGTFKEVFRRPKKTFVDIGTMEWKKKEAHPKRTQRKRMGFSAHAQWEKEGGVVPARCAARSPSVIVLLASLRGRGRPPSPPLLPE